MPPRPFLSANTFKLTDPSVTYTLQLDATNLPTSIMANFAVSPSRDLINVNDNVYLITYNTVSTGSLLGQGQASIAITNSGFTLTNPLRYDESEIHLRRRSTSTTRRRWSANSPSICRPRSSSAAPPTRSTRATWW